MSFSSNKPLKAVPGEEEAAAGNDPGHCLGELPQVRVQLLCLLGNPAVIPSKG
jgi:hypothetical protein